MPPYQHEHQNCALCSSTDVNIKMLPNSALPRLISKFKTLNECTITLLNMSPFTTSHCSTFSTSDRLTFSTHLYQKDGRALPEYPDSRKFTFPPVKCSVSHYFPHSLLSFIHSSTLLKRATLPTTLPHAILAPASRRTMRIVSLLSGYYRDRMLQKCAQGYATSAFWPQVTTREQSKFILGTISKKVTRITI